MHVPLIERHAQAEGEVVVRTHGRHEGSLRHDARKGNDDRAIAVLRYLDSAVEGTKACIVALLGKVGNVKDNLAVVVGRSANALVVIPGGYKNIATGDGHELAEVRDVIADNANLGRAHNDDLGLAGIGGLFRPRGSGRKDALAVKARQGNSGSKRHGPGEKSSSRDAGLGPGIVALVHGIPRSRNPRLAPLESLERQRADPMGE